MTDQRKEGMMGVGAEGVNGCEEGTEATGRDERKKNKTQEGE